MLDLILTALFYVFKSPYPVGTIITGNMTVKYPAINNPNRIQDATCMELKGLSHPFLLALFLCYL